MSAQTETTDDTTNDVESEAREMGWAPQDEFRGDKAKWVDATTFVEHGRKVMPILKKNNQEMIKDMSALRLQVNRLTKDLEGAREDLTTYQEFHQEELVRKVKETRAEALRQLEVASEEGDHKNVAKLTDQLAQLATAEKETERAVNGHDKNAGKTDEQPPLDPSFLAWTQANPLFDRDEVFTFKALGIAAQMRKEGLQGTLTGKAWFDEVDKRLNGGDTQRRNNGKVLSSKGGGSNGGGGNDSSYDSLPADAKAACAKFEKKFVRENGTWKTVAEYRKHYAEVYNKTN